jgi:hypothetical protein
MSEVAINVMWWIIASLVLWVVTWDFWSKSKYWQVGHIILGLSTLPITLIVVFFCMITWLGNLFEKLWEIKIIKR